MMNPNDVQYYLDLITSAWAEQPNYTAVVSLSVAPACQVQSLLASMIPLFDLSTPPVGNQLDILGQWVGVSRNVSIPITGVFFSWDTAAVGWDLGVWANGNQTSITTLPDDVYLNLILGTIAANNWDGTTEGAYTILNQVFPNLGFGIQDYTNMTFALIVVGQVDALTQQLIVGGYINLRPEGVQIIHYYFAPVGPVFAFDLNVPNFQGWDSGHWATAF